MNMLPYLQFALAALVAAAILFLLSTAIRRKQKYRIFELSIFGLALVYIAVDTAFPTLKVTAPQIMDSAFIALSLLFVANGIIYYKTFLKNQKVLLVERR